MLRAPRLRLGWLVWRGLGVRIYIIAFRCCRAALCLDHAVVLALFVDVCQVADTLPLHPGRGICLVLASHQGAGSRLVQLPSLGVNALEDGVASSS